MLFFFLILLLSPPNVSVALWNIDFLLESLVFIQNLLKSFFTSLLAFQSLSDIIKGHLHFNPLINPPISFPCSNISSSTHHYKLIPLALKSSYKNLYRLFSKQRLSAIDSKRSQSGEFARRPRAEAENQVSH